MTNPTFRIADTNKWLKCKKIKKAHEIVLHDTGVRPQQTPEIIDAYHRSIGFTQGIGYDIYITDKGLCETQRLWKDMLGAHAYGHNLYSIGICVSGQEFTIEERGYLKQALNIITAMRPDIQIIYHKEISKNRRDPHQQIVDFIEQNYSEYRAK